MFLLRGGGEVSGAEAVRATPETVRMSTLLQTMVEDGDEGDEVDVVVPGADGDALRRVCEFCDLLTSSSSWTVTESVPASIQPWLSSLFPDNTVSDAAYKVLTAANFLHIQLLLDVCIAKFAAVLLCLTPETMESVFVQKQ